MSGEELWSKKTCRNADVVANHDNKVSPLQTFGLKRLITDAKSILLWITQYSARANVSFPFFFIITNNFCIKSCGVTNKNLDLNIHFFSFFFYSTFSIYHSIQGDCIPAGGVLCSTDPCTRQSVQLGSNGEVHMRRFPRHPASRSVAVGGLRWQRQIQHQVSQKVPRPEEGQQGPQGSGRCPQHQRWNSGECRNIASNVLPQNNLLPEARGNETYAWATLSSICWPAILHDNYTFDTVPNVKCHWSVIFARVFFMVPAR